MIKEVTIENFKSIRKLKLELGRVNVLIGENGSGKSNLLEGIALASAAAASKLDNEFLSSRGIRSTDPQFMCSAFDSEGTTQEISIKLVPEKGPIFIQFIKIKREETFSKLVGSNNFTGKLYDLLKTNPAFTAIVDNKKESEFVSEIVPILIGNHLVEFLIYSPENTALRTFQTESQILPLGIKGEGLLAHLRALFSLENRSYRDEIIEKLELLNWFEGLEIPSGQESKILIRDKYLSEGLLFDQRSANEGFLFLLFYFALFVSPDTPDFFAIDNIDASLNPKMCRVLLQQLVLLAKKHEKQVILTTHNPALLDGLDLQDEEQRLFVIDRNKDGHTRALRIESPKEVPGAPSLSLSERFVRGFIGGLPNNF